MQSIFQDRGFLSSRFMLDLLDVAPALDVVCRSCRRGGGWLLRITFDKLLDGLGPT